MENNQKPEVKVVIISDSADNETESLGLLKEKKSFSLYQIKSYLFIALTMAEWDIDVINGLFKILEIIRDNVPANEAIKYLKNITKKKGTIYYERKNSSSISHGHWLQ